jgi:hypothetical protein
VVVVDTENGFAPAAIEPLVQATPVVPLGQRPVPSQEEVADTAPPQEQTTRHVGADLEQAIESAEPAILSPATSLPDEQRIAELVRELVCGEHVIMTRAREALTEIGPSCIDAVMEQFPGALVFDIRGPHDTIPPLSEHSELLHCLIEFGADACTAVAVRLDDPDTRIRYYAVKFFGDTYCPRFVPQVVKRLYDSDALIRLTSIDVLQTYRKTPAFNKMLAELRSGLKNTEPNQQAIAAALLGNFKDRDALPLLTGLLKSSQKMVSRAAAESLSYITKQDFGTSERKWLKWWRIHKGQNRIQWLIAGLRSKNRDIRFSSAHELYQLTQEYFGYYYDSRKDEREKAVRRWERWWEEKGRRMHFDDT